MTKQLVFIDESGDPGFKSNSSQNFAFALVVFDKPEDAEITENKLIEISKKSRHSPEFKFSKTSNHVKDCFFNDIATCPFHAYAIYVNKMLIKSNQLRENSNSFYNYFLKQVITHANLQDASLKLDGKKDTVKKELITYLKSQAGSSISKIRYEDSKNNRLIQLADMIVGLVTHSYAPTATQQQKDWLKQIKAKLNIWQFR